MANSGRAEGSVCATGICLSSACDGCTSSFSYQCGIEYWVTRTPGTRNGVVNYKLQIRGNGGGYITSYTLNCWDVRLNGASFGYITMPWQSPGTWYDLPGVTGSVGFTYSDDGSAPGVVVNGGGAQFQCRPFCMGSCYTTLGGFTVYPDRCTVDWNRRPGSVSGSSTNTKCDGTTLKFNVGDPGIPSNITSVIEYGTSTGYGNTTAASSARSGSFSISGLKPATTYHYRVKTTNPTGTTYSGDYTVKTKGSAPTYASETATNPGAFRAIFAVSGINWKGGDSCPFTTKKASLTWKYTMDGKNYSFTKTWDKSELDVDSLTFDTGIDKNRIPDDETLSYTWTLGTDVATMTKSGTLYCQQSYDAYVIGPRTDNKWIECDLYVSEKAGVDSYKKVRRVTSIKEGE